MKNFFYRTFLLITASIAFYPALIAVGFFVFALLIMFIEYLEIFYSLKENISFVLVNNVEDGRLILSTLVGSIFSLMVFSFSMVMVVLNRASATLSPRVIPGLIGEKSHQTVLGFYIGTIVYCLVLIINIQNPDAEYQIPSLGIFFATVFGLMCLAMFIFFIDSISRSIQVDNVLKKILDQTLREMEALSSDEKVEVYKKDWQTLYARANGYFKRVQTKELFKICQKHDLIVEISKPNGFFLVKGYPYLKVLGEVNDEIEIALAKCFVFYPEEHISDHYAFGFKQISEIAVKALSPGINDPATAIKSIDMLSVLFIKKMGMDEKYFKRDDEGTIRLYFKEITLDQLLYENLTPIQEYGKTDMKVMLNILESLKNMLYADKSSNKNKKVLLEYTESMVKTCHRYVETAMDLKVINNMIGIINEIVSEKFDVIPLEKIGRNEMEE